MTKARPNPPEIEPGDVIVKFDGKDVKEMRDLPKIVADTPVGKDVEVVVIRKGKGKKRRSSLAASRMKRESRRRVRTTEGRDA